MKEKKDTLIELLTNEDFKKWILEPTYERELFWSKWLESDPERKELVNAAKEFIRSAKYRNISLEPGDKDEILSNIISQSSIKTEHSRRQGPRLQSGLIYKIAASILIIATFLSAIWWERVQEIVSDGVGKQISMIEKSNPQGRKSIIFLPDGTRVTLNSESKISYTSDYGSEDRTVSLEGEAFFEVKHDKTLPFNVISDGVMTTALGTSFNVRAFSVENVLKVSLKTGKVKVAKMINGDPKEHLLDPGEGFVIPKQGGEIKKVAVDPLLEFGWKDGMLVFKDNNLVEVVQALERWYGVKINVTGQPQKQWRVDGTFENETLEHVLNGLSYTHDLEFLINGKNVELKLK